MSEVLPNAQPKQFAGMATTALMARIEMSGGGFNLFLPADAPPALLEMARARLARCPGCKSHDIKRMKGRSADEGPMDKCANCGQSFAHKPGTITAEMHAARQDGYGEGAFPDVPGTTDTAGWTDEDPPVPPVLDADGNPIDPDDDDEGGLTDTDQDILRRAIASPTFASRLAQSMTI